MKEDKENQSMYIRADFFKGTLHLNMLPLLNKQVPLRFSFSREFIEKVGSANPTIEFDLPPGIIVEGDSRVENFAGTELVKNITITKIGTYRIKSYIEAVFPPQNGFSIHKESQEYFLCFKTIDESTAEIINCADIINDGIKMGKVR